MIQFLVNPLPQGERVWACSAKYRIGIPVNTEFSPMSFQGSKLILEDIWAMETTPSISPSGEKNAKSPSREKYAKSPSREKDAKSPSREKKTRQSVFLQYDTYGHSMRAERDFLSKLKSYFHKRNVNLYVEAYRGGIPIAANKQLLLFCVNSTRVGTDAQAALRRIGDEPVILIVMNHFHKKTNLANPHSAAHVAQSNVRAVVDCFFFESDGTYDCKQNEDAVEQVAKEIMSMPNTPGHHDNVETKSPRRSSDGSSHPQPENWQFNQRSLENDDLQVVLQYQKTAANEEFLNELESDLQKWCHQKFQDVTRSISSNVETSTFHVNCPCPAADILSVVRHIEAVSLISVSIKHKPMQSHAVGDVFLFQTNKSYSSDENQEVLRLMEEKITKKKSKNNAGSTLQTDDTAMGTSPSMPPCGEKNGNRKVQKTQQSVFLQYDTYGHSMGAERDFLSKLKSYFHKRNVDLYVEACTRGTPIAANKQLLLFCVNSTRVGTDAQAALRRIGDEPVILIVMNHFHKKTNLANPHSAAHVAQSNVRAVVDCFFFESDGTYDCKQNEDAVEQVAKAIMPVPNTPGHHDNVETKSPRRSSDGSAHPQPENWQFNQRSLENDDLQVVLQYQKTAANEECLNELESDLQKWCHQKFQDATRSISSNVESSTFHVNCPCPATDILSVARLIEAGSLISVSIKHKPMQSHVFLFQTNKSHSSDDNQEVLRLMEEKSTKKKSKNNAGRTLQTDDTINGNQFKSEDSAKCSDKGKPQTTPSTSSFQVQYYVHGKSHGAEDDFLEKLRSCLHEQYVNVRSPKDLSTCGPMPGLIFCVNASKVATEANKALGHVKGQPAVLIVMNNFPKETYRKAHHSAEHIQAENVLVVVDCFFFESDGMYDCEENNQAVERVAKEIASKTNISGHHADIQRIVFTKLI
uniref:uncharacterized protein isoform X2 n=1 Tax=Myxine glutinosa TaxID=7769 RepID=UPI00358F5EAE